MSNPNDKKPDDLEINVLESVSHILDESSIGYKRRVSVGSVSSDFYVETPTGGTIIFEVKVWDPSPENIARAKALSQSITTASGVDNTYFIIPSLSISSPENNALNLIDLINVINQPGNPKPKGKKPKVSRIPKKKIFAIMPYAILYTDTFYAAMEPAAKKLGYECIRADIEFPNGDQVNHIKQSIKQSEIVIADLSELKPNVLYELGFADGIKKEVIQICSTQIDDLPFDVRNNNTISYSIGQTTVLRDVLIKCLRQIIEQRKSLD